MNIPQLNLSIHSPVDKNLCFHLGAQQHCQGHPRPRVLMREHETPGVSAEPEVQARHIEDRLCPHQGITSTFLQLRKQHQRG